MTKGVAKIVGDNSLSVDSFLTDVCFNNKIVRYIFIAKLFLKGAKQIIVYTYIIKLFQSLIFYILLLIFIYLMTTTSMINNGWIVAIK